MGPIAPVVAALVDSLQGEGIRATADLAMVNPPAVYAVPEHIDHLTGCSGQLQVALFAVVPDQNDWLALQALDAVVCMLFDALDDLELPYGFEPVRASRVPTSTGGAELPAWRVVTQVTV